MSKSGFAKDQLKSFIDRVERLEEEKAALAADIREVFSEAKSTGFCTKTMRKLIARRKLDRADLQEQDAMLDLYSTALGMDGLPFGDYAERMQSEQKAQAAAGKKPAAEPKKAAPQPPATESQAKADADALAKANTQSAASEESVSRGASARSPAATSEIMGVTGGESATPSILEIPSFLDRRERPSPVPA